MRIGFWNVSATVVLGLAIAFIAKDLTMPMAGFALLGILDRIAGSGLLRFDARTPPVAR